MNAVMTAPSDTDRELFERFLVWLSPDYELALKKYSEIMKKMDKYFTRKGCLDAEELASETRMRVIKIVNGAQKYPNSDALFYSVAAKVWKEFARKPRTDPLPADDMLAMPQGEADDKERQASCLDRCLAQLSEPERDLITRYYEVRGRNNTESRKLLITEHGGENTWRVKAFRIRGKLRNCINACMDETAK